MRDADATDAMVNHTYEITKRIEDIETVVAETEAATRAFIATGDRRWLRTFKQDEEQAFTLLNEIRHTIVDPQQEKRIDELEQVIRRKFSFEENTINIDTISRELLARVDYDGEDRLITVRLKQVTQQFGNRQNVLLQQRLTASNEAKSKILLTAIIGSALIFIFILGTLVKLNWDIRRRKNAEKEIRESESKYRQLIEEAGVTMFTADLGGMFTYVSSRCQSLTGYTSEELTGKSFSILVLPDSIENVIAAYMNQVSTGQRESTIEFPIITRDGNLKWVEQHAVLLVNEFLEPTGYQCVVRDITERKQAEQRIKASEEQIQIQREEYQFRLQSILDNSPAIVFIKDLKGRYLLINKSFREIFGRSDEQVIGKTDLDFETPEMAARYKQSDDEVISTLRSIESEETLNCPGRGIQNLLLVKFPLFDKNNNIYGVGGIATNFTENVQNRQKLIAAKKKAESAEQLQEQFLANMSHEIRTPMNGITGMTNILMNTNLDEKQKEFVTIIKQSSDNLLFLINDILDLSKIKAGKLTLEKTPFSLKEIITNTLAPFQLKAQEKKIDLLLVQTSQLPGTIQGDPYRLNQILNNLLSNAMKFTENGSVTLTVKQLKQTEEEAWLEFSVSDTGIGIPADKLDNIFNSFEQANYSTTRQYGGTGLGLAITRQLVEMQGGKIGIKSTSGAGTTFHFTIRYDLQKEETLSENPFDNAMDNSQLAGKRILVAEDNEINQKVIFHVLEKENVQVTLACNGREAVTLMEHGKMFDLIIMDLQMPIMDGFQAATYIRKKLQCNTPIIAMTASVLRNERIKCFELGMNEYLSKPFVPAELFMQLKRLLFPQATQYPTSNTRSVPGPHSLMISTTASYSLSYLQEMDDNEYLCEILQLFLETTPAILDELSNDVLHENWDKVGKHAHKLKSSLGVLHMNSMLELTATIEQRAKGNVETGRIEADVKKLTEQFSLIRPMIEAELSAALVKV